MSLINQKYRAVVAGMALILAAPMVLAKPTVKATTETQQSIARRSQQNPVNALQAERQALYEKAVTGDAEAQYQFGLSLQKRGGHITNCDLAARWFLKAAAQGHEHAVMFVINCGSPGSHNENYSKEILEEMSAFAKGYEVACQKYEAKSK